MKKFSFVSQDPSLLSVKGTAFAKRYTLPIVTDVWNRIERETGFRWKCTSFIRNAPSHKRGTAVDIAPDIALESKRHYAVTHQRNPVLYKREFLLRALQRVVRGLPDYPYTVGVFVEPAHLHIGLFDPVAPRDHRLVKWGVENGGFKDNDEKMQLPLQQ